MAENSLITRYKADNSDFVKKTKEAKNALDQFGTKGTEIGNRISQITNLLNINVGALSKLSVALGGAAAALKVSHDAFFKNEANLDEWGRKVESTKSVYNGFLNALNNGDISGYLSNINSIIQAARDAYDAMDELGTYNAFSQREVARNKAGYAEALDAYKLNPNAANKEALTNANAAVIKDLTDAQALTEESYRTGLQRLAKERGLSAQQQQRFVELFSSGNYNDLKSAKASYSTGTGFHMFDQLWNGNQVLNGKIRENNTWRLMTDMEKDQFEFARALSQTNDTEIEAIQKEGAKSQALADAISQQNKSFNRMAGNYSSGGGKGGDLPPAVGSIDEIKQNITDLNKQLSAAVTDEARRNIRAMIAEAETRLKGMQAATSGSGLDLKLSSGATAPTGVSQLADSAANIDTSAIDKKWQSLQKLAKASETASEKAMEASNAFSAIGSALQSIEDPAAKVMGIVAMAIANLAGTFAKSLEGTFTPWDWIAAAAAGTATLISSITAIQNATSRYANGGEIKGNSYSGDNLLMPVMGGGAVAVNAGEYVFNRAQMGNLAAQLRGGSEQRAQEIRVRIENDQLVGTLRNANSRASYHA